MGGVSHLGGCEGESGKVLIEIHEKGEGLLKKGTEGLETYNLLNWGSGESQGGATSISKRD